MTPGDPGFSGTLLAVAIALAAIAILSIVVWRLALLVPGNAVAAVEAGAMPPHAFDLRHVTTADRAYRLALRMRVHGNRWGDSTGTGVVCRLRVTVGGAVVADEAIGFGSSLPGPVDRIVTKGYMMRETRHDSEVVRMATYVLASIPRCPAGTVIVVAGTFEAGPGTEASLLEVFLGR